MSKQVIPTSETLLIEFKSDCEKLNDDELVEAVICLANAQGGSLYLGVENDASVTGLNTSRPRDISGLAVMIANRTAPALQVAVDEVMVQGQRVALIQVPLSTAVIARSDGLVKRRRIGGDGRPECVPFLPHEYSSRNADFCLTDMSAKI